MADINQYNMSKKAFDYSKWDNIELSDDEDDLHPNIDRESWFRMKHRSRVEREDNEAKDKAKIQAEVSVSIFIIFSVIFDWSNPLNSKQM